MKPDFKLAYIKANEMLVSNSTIEAFPFSAKALLKEKSDIRCKTYSKAMEYNVDITDFGSESAVLFKMGNKKIVFYDDSKPMTHINFSILHESGHDDMGHVMSKDISQELYDKQEVEANFYAAQILMPEQLLRYLQRQGVRIDRDFLTRSFGVSPEAADKRINTLAKTNDEWRSRSEKEFDDLILDRYLPLIQHLCPQNAFDYEDDINMQRERDSWFSRRWY